VVPQGGRELGALSFTQVGREFFVLGDDVGAACQQAVAVAEEQEALRSVRRSFSSSRTALPLASTDERWNEIVAWSRS
jgi:hypothetical protein